MAHAWACDALIDEATGERCAFTTTEASAIMILRGVRLPKNRDDHFKTLYEMHLCRPHFNLAFDAVGVDMEGERPPHKILIGRLDRQQDAEETPEERFERRLLAGEL